MGTRISGVRLSVASLRRLAVVFAGLSSLIAFFLAATAEASTRRFINVGLGGGGAMYAPSCSPHDHNLMFVACDMGGVYRSADGGRSWSLLDKRQLRDAIRQRIGSPVQFDSTNPDLAYAIGRGKLLVSHDRGVSFTSVVRDPPWKNDIPTAVYVYPFDGSQLLVGAGTSPHWLGAFPYKKASLDLRHIAASVPKNRADPEFEHTSPLTPDKTPTDRRNSPGFLTEQTVLFGILKV